MTEVVVPMVLERNQETVKKPAPRRLREHRLNIGSVNLQGAEAVGVHGTIGAFRAQIEDLSLHGAALILSNASESTNLVFAGDRLTDFRIETSTGALYNGSASVRRVSERGQDLVLGVQLDDRGVDLSRVYLAGSRCRLASRMKAALKASQDIHIFAEYKAWVADLRAYLVTTKNFLDNEEKPLDDLDQLTREQTLKAYLDEVAPIVVARLNAASQELAEYASRLAEDQHPHYRAYYRSHLYPLMRESPILKRTFEKPLGYAGDYEMMNMLYRDHSEGTSLFGKVLNIYAAQEPAARANINRLEYLSKRIREKIDSPAALAAKAEDGASRRLRIASIGCGPAREISKLLQEHPEVGPHLEVALIDQEERALAFCERTIGPLAVASGANVHVIKESVRRLLGTRELSQALGECDLIYSAGLFDYLTDRSVSALMSSLYEGLVTGGELLIGNVAAHNPTRHFMEYCLDWFLIHRSPEDLLAYAAPLSPKPRNVQVDSEPLGVNLFLRVWK